MRTALVILLICAAVDLILSATLLAVVWIEYRRQRKQAAAIGDLVPEAAGEFGCLIAFGIVGFVVLYGCVWLLL